MFSSRANASSSPYSHLSTEYLRKMQNERFEVFKNQDLETGGFDKLNASKHMLTTISEPFNAMLSSRWTRNKDELISEFFGVTYLKEFCDEFLSDMKKTVETIEEMYEHASLYSLPKLTNSIKHFILYGRNEKFNVEKFLTYKKSFVEFLSAIGRDADYSQLYDDNILENESKFFEYVYNWAEHQVMQREDVKDQSISLEEAIKNELEPILPNIKFGKMNLEFLMDFVLEKGFILSPTELVEFFETYRVCEHTQKEENLFKSVYELVEWQALKKQTMAQNDENLNVAVSIKNDLAQIIPKVKFYEMNKTFLNDFVVGNGIITEEEASHVDDIRVEIKSNGKNISGVFKDHIGFCRAYENVSCNLKCKIFVKLRFSQFKFSLPTTPSTVTKANGVDWYLCLEEDGVFTFKHHSFVNKNDYLLAEMKSETEFKLNYNDMTHLTVFPKIFNAYDS